MEDVTEIGYISADHQSGEIDSDKHLMHDIKSHNYKTAQLD
jgi:hypothetical protein